MTWNVTTTILTSVFGSVILVSALYLCYGYILPHVRRPKDKPDFTLPHVRRPSDPRLQESLYSLPSPNFIDPRNSVADTELRSSRWSTSIHDLDGTASPTPTPWSKSPLPRSPRMHFRDASDNKSTASPRHEKSKPKSPVTTPKMQQTLRREPVKRHRRKAKSQTLRVEVGKRSIPNHGRLRSKSDSMVSMPGLLARSHSALHGSGCAPDLLSPTTSNFSGTTLLSSPRTPQQGISNSGGKQTVRPFSSVGHHRQRNGEKNDR